MQVVPGCRVALRASGVLFLLLLGACGKDTAAAADPKLAKALADAKAAGKVVFVGVGRTEDAMAIAAVALTNAGDDVRSMFVRAAQRAGHGELADRLRSSR